MQAVLSSCPQSAATKQEGALLSPSFGLENLGQGF